ncbi:class II aldolase/adducin family protein [Thermoanaerobacterium sp. DL9XJH110]|uniref:class II aldolase/adducin family protein n=1 Tax=Thermoanaerobacterium sp. DL9XJH110 TaxID=3386643 RepID=UPI003BB4CF50
MNVEKRELVEYCRNVYSKGMVTGSGGNISLRVNERVLITPTGYSLGRIRENEISVVDLDGNLIEGEKPSKEIGLHLSIYKKMPSVNAIIHVHSLYSICVGILTEKDSEIIPFYTPGFASKVGPVALVPYFKPGSKELADAVSETIKGKKAVIMKNHGLITIGQNLEEAFNIAEDVEANAKLHILLNGKGQPLSEESIKELLGVKN